MAMRLPFPSTHRRIPTLPSFASFTPRRRNVSMASAKRSPKRLKYSTPRFTKEGEFVSIEVDPSGADSWKLKPVIELLKQGAVGVIPTDTVYAIVCDCKNHSAVERLRRLVLSVLKECVYFTSESILLPNIYPVWSVLSL